MISCAEVTSHGRLEQIIGQAGLTGQHDPTCLAAQEQEEREAVEEPDDGCADIMRRYVGTDGGECGKVERTRREGLSIPIEKLADLSATCDMSSAAAGSSLSDLCHDLIEPTATIRWLVRAADAESGHDLRNRLGAIAVAAGQIAAICEHILDRPQRCAGVRLDLLADDAVASAQVRYAGMIEISSQPVTALAGSGDVVRILTNILTNACRAAGPAGRVRVLVDESDGQARLAIDDSGSGLGHVVPGGRAGLGLEIIGALALKYGGSVLLGISDLGGLAVTVQVPAQGRSSN